MKFFGFQLPDIKLVNSKNNNLDSLPKDENLDGAIDLDELFSGYRGYGLNLSGDNLLEDESQLILRYREMSGQPEIMKAIDNIVNQAFAYDEQASPVKLNLDDLEDRVCPPVVKENIIKEFDNIIKMLNFKNDAYDIFKKFYVDGRLYYQKVIDRDNPNNGIQELRWIDPCKIRKVRKTVKQQKDLATQVEQVEFIEYYVYNKDGINAKAPIGDSISKDSISFAHSGLFDKSNRVILSYLHQAIKGYNQLKLVEDAILIYRISRAPERRIFNVEIGKMPKHKAEQHMTDVMQQYNKKSVYNPMTGEIQDQKRIMSMMEDFWFAKRGGEGTTVDILQGGQNLGQLEDVEYFKRMLHASLNIPQSRYEQNSGFNLGRSSEITRDELLFMKFIHRLRTRFSGIFSDILRTQLILKNIIKEEEWDTLQNKMYFDFNEDVYFTELKENEIWMNRMETYNNAKLILQDGMVSKKWLRTKILHISDEEFEEMQEDIEKEQLEQKQKDREMAMISAMGNPMSPFNQQDNNGLANMPMEGLPQQPMPPQLPPSGFFDNPQQEDDLDYKNDTDPSSLAEAIKRI